MNSLIVSMMLVMGLALLLASVGKLITKKSLYDRELQSPFECGFPTLTESRMSFSLHFFMVALVFAVFDVEILILFPITIDSISILSWSCAFIYVVLILILTAGLVNEWNQLILEWSK